MADKRPALGKGLSALIPDAPEPQLGPFEIDIDLLTPNRFQPRAAIDDARLDDLARSIKSSGVIQPIIVSPSVSGYQIIAGERRWRAAQRAGLLRVPVVVRDLDTLTDRQRLEMALIENIQREDLNPLEEASAYQRLIDEFHLKQDDIAAVVGKDRSSVANYVRLLRLPEEVRAAIAAGTLSMGHARALLSLPDEARQRQTARDVIVRNLSVRETESLVKHATESQPSAAAPKPQDVHTRAAEDRLKLALGTRVQITRRGKGGTIQIAFTSEDELQRLYEYLTDRQ